MTEHLTPLNADRLFELAAKRDMNEPALSDYDAILAAARAAMGDQPGEILPAFKLYARGLRVTLPGGRMKQAVVVHQGDPDGGVLLGSWTRSDLPSVNAGIVIDIGERLSRLYGLGREMSASLR